MPKSSHHIIGTGRWGSWLARRLKAKGFEIASVRNRSESSALELAAELDVDWSMNDLDKGIDFQIGDIIWCCIPDDGVAELYNAISLRFSNVQVVHCSGTMPLLDGDSTGVLWPIQSFTKATEPDWMNLPIIVQSDNPAFAKTLHSIASTISGITPKQVYQNEDRMRLHLGAVMTQNFSNFLWTLTEEVLAKVPPQSADTTALQGNEKEIKQESNLTIQDLLPLALNHLTKLNNTPPSMLQTGPAIRGDQNTLSAHLKLLEGSPEAKEIYTLLSKHIAHHEI